MQKAAELLF